MNGLALYSNYRNPQGVNTFKSGLFGEDSISSCSLNLARLNPVKGRCHDDTETSADVQWRAHRASEDRRFLQEWKWQKIS
jgi:hypothetical protein